MDTNTSKNESADVRNIEYLLRKRFGLTASPLERFETFCETVDMPYFPEIEGYNMNIFKKQYRHVQALRKMQDEFLMELMENSDV